VRFDRSYCNYPVCNASRTSFLSGRYPETTRVLGNATDPRIKLGNDFQFLPEFFKANGSFIAGVGKIAHGRFAQTVKWDSFAEPMTGVDEDDKPAQPARRQARRGGAAAPKAEQEPVPFNWQATSNKDEQEPDGEVAAKIVKLLETHKDKPFFIAAGFHKPHVPHTAPKKYFDMYPPAQMPLPTGPTGHTKDIPTIAHPPKYFPALKDIQKQEIISHYYAATSFMDAQVGHVLDAVDRLNLWDNTVVIFLGDHGWHLGEHEGFWAKMSVMEESARAPLICAAPGMKSAAVANGLVEFVDIYPTLTELAHLPAPAGLEGASFAQLLADPQHAGKKAVFTVVNRQGKLGHSVRTAQYTYTEWPDGSTQLYDHSQDSKEYFNLAKDSGHAAVVAELKQLLKEGWQAAKPTAGQ
jgi:uncharacterized sulfatase